MSAQCTLKQSVSVSGIGLHSGNRVTLNLLPAPPDTGYRFRRIDLEGRPELDARLENVVDTQRSTTLGKGNVKIQTVEHLLAALSGSGVTNAIIELDANEPPIGDGSSLEFSTRILEAGIVSQPETVECCRVLQPLEIEIGESRMSAFPSDRFRVSCTSSDRQGRFTQYYSTEVTPATWGQELAGARTFCFFEEIEYLIRNGLIRGGSLENAIVIREDAVLTTEPLRFPEEFVRHKILDIVGDLALIGRPLLANIVAIKPSHRANTELAKAILAQDRRAREAIQTFSPPPAITEAKTPGSNSTDESKVGMVRDGATLDVQAVMRILPHRPPFLMVDRVTRIEGNHVTAIKNVTLNEPYFAGHFPGHPVMPGVLQLEAIAQVSGILMMRQAENADKIAYFMSADNVKWRHPVYPGDVLTIDIELTKTRGKIGRARGVCSVNGTLVSEAEVTFVLMDRH